MTTTNPQAGKNMKLFDGTGTTNLIAGIRSPSVKFDGETVDITNIDSNGAKELGEAMGVSSVQVQCRGVLTDAAVHGSLGTRALARTLNPYRVQFGTKALTGNAQISSAEFSGDYNAAQLYNITLDFSGDVTLT